MRGVGCGVCVWGGGGDGDGGGGGGSMRHMLIVTKGNVPCNLNPHAQCHLQGHVNFKEWPMLCHLCQFSQAADEFSKRIRLLPFYYGNSVLVLFGKIWKRIGIFLGELQPDCGLKRKDIWVCRAKAGPIC